MRLGSCTLEICSPKSPIGSHQLSQHHALKPPWSPPPCNKLTTPAKSLLGAHNQGLGPSRPPRVGHHLAWWQGVGTPYCITQCRGQYVRWWSPSALRTTNRPLFAPSTASPKAHNPLCSKFANKMDWVTIHAKSKWQHGVHWGREAIFDLPTLAWGPHGVDQKSLHRKT